MEWLELTRASADSIRANKLRSGLTTLGVVIGVASVILLVSIGEGMRNYLADIFAGMGSNILFVSSGKRDTRGAGKGLSTVRKITLEDAQALRQRSLNVVAVAPIVMGGGTVEHGSLSRESLVMGVDENMPLVRTLPLGSGRFISAEDEDGKRRVAVIGRKVARELFGERSVLGLPIKIADARFRIIGIMAPKGQSLGYDFDEMVYIPVSCALDLFNLEGLTSVWIKAGNQTNLQPAIDDVRRILKNRHNNREDFTVVSQADLLETVNQITATMTLVLLGIASISLLVGGIGIMNIMLVSVRERTREIGVRKALGARRRDILLQFLIESVMVSLMGGLVGLALGSLIALGVHAAVPDIPVKITPWSLFVAFGFSMAVGVFFGVAPAQKAAALDPIESLRYE
ncbi:MAG TPA: ABC transporter permease [Myxococcota bacterium]|nr:ABC transporter permease [Myxococcota bacterium]